MSRNEYQRRTVLKATAGTVGIVGSSGLAAGDVSLCGDPVFETGEYVGPDDSVTGYDDCTDPTYVVTIDGGSCGYVRDRCCDGLEWTYLVEFDEYEELVWIAESDLTRCDVLD